MSAVLGSVAAVVVAVLLWPPAGGPAGSTSVVGSAGAARASRGLPSGGGGSTGRGRRGRPDVDDALAELLALVCAPLEAGVPPATVLAAVREPTRDGPLEALVADLHTAAASGRPLGPVWEQWAETAQSPALRFVARAWTLSDHAGAPLAEALGCAVSVLRSQRQSRQRLASAVAGPRASMAVLVVLPVAGPVVGLVCGLSPAELYLGQPAASASALLGLLLGVVAYWWSRRILARAG